MPKKASPKLAPMPPPPDGMRDMILAEAARLFRIQGYTATTLRQIADALDIKAGSIYYHFASKEEILGEVLDTGMKMVTDSLQQRLDALPPTASFKERLAVGIEGHLYGMLHFGDFTSANIRIYGQIPASAKAKHRSVRYAYAQIWDRLFEQALASGELRADTSLSVMRLFVIGALNWTVEWYNPTRGSFEEFARQIKAIIFEGILSPASAKPKSARTRP